MTIKVPVGVNLLVLWHGISKTLIPKLHVVAHKCMEICPIPHTVMGLKLMFFVVFFFIFLMRVIFFHSPWDRQNSKILFHKIATDDYSKLKKERDSELLTKIFVSVFHQFLRVFQGCIQLKSKLWNVKVMVTFLFGWGLMLDISDVNCVLELKRGWETLV